MFKSLLFSCSLGLSYSATITEQVLADDRLSGLKGLVGDYPDITTALNDKDSKLTLFAPSNDAVAALVDPPADLTNILLYHVISGEVKAQNVIDGSPLFPDTLYTVDGADFAQKLAALSDGTSVTIGGATVTVADVECDNGVIHIVDAVLMPPKITSDVATDAGLTTLATLLGDAELVDTVNDFKTQYTIFAPVNDGFPAELPAGFNLETTLLNHVVGGSRVFSTDLTDGQEVTLAGGAKVTISIVNGEVSVGGSKVVTANVLTQNSVVHVIDKIIDGAIVVDSSSSTGADASSTGADASSTGGDGSSGDDSNNACMAAPFGAVAAASIAAMMV